MEVEEKAGWGFEERLLDSKLRITVGSESPITYYPNVAGQPDESLIEGLFTSTYPFILPAQSWGGGLSSFHWNLRRASHGVLTKAFRVISMAG